MKKKWARSAMRIASAKYVARRDILDVRFENGEAFVVPIEAVVTLRRASPGTNGVALVAPKWSKMRIGEAGDVLEVPVGDSLIEIPWDRIRTLADPDFRALWVNQASKRTRLLGGRVRELRLDAGLSREELAEKISVPKGAIAKLESGSLQPAPALMKTIAQALGKRLRDLVINDS